MFDERRLLITGGTGRLGKACRKIFPHAIYPTRKDMDITNINMIESFLGKHNPTNIIHLAALASIPGCEENKQLARNINVVGTKNLINIVKELGTVNKFIYLQSACIFSGENAPYDENSIPDPKHYYGFSKACAEEIVKTSQSQNHNFKTIIVRTNFTTMPWEYPKAFTDRYGTYLFAQGVAKGIKDVLIDNKGLQVIHIVGDKRISMYDYAIAGGSNVEKLTLDEYKGVCLTRDMSLVTKKWHPYNLKDSGFNDK